MSKHKYPIIKDIGLVVHSTYEIELKYFDRIWKFNVRSKSEENISKSCLTYYSPMWNGSLDTFLTKNDIIIDIGAHVGFFAIPISSMVKQVIAFEPAPANYELLQRNIAKNNIKNILALNTAVDARKGIIELRLGIRGTTGHSVVVNKKGGVRTTVNCTNLSNIVKVYNPTVLKIDCEGSEWNILTDENLLKNIKIIIAELHRVKRYDVSELENVIKMAGMEFKIKHNSWFSKLIAWRKNE